MVSHDSRQELLGAAHPRYAQARRCEKTVIFDELVANSGCNRKYAITLLHHPREKTVCRKRREKRRYTLPVQAALIAVWRSSNCTCGKRLVPCMEMFFGALERHGELAVDADTRHLLLSISTATAYRLLHHERQNKGRGPGTHKPGILLKKSIAIRTFGDWDDKRPVFFEAQLVAHCGDSTGGDFVHTLMVVDVATGWTDLGPGS